MPRGIGDIDQCAHCWRLRNGSTREDNHSDLCVLRMKWHLAIVVLFTLKAAVADYDNLVKPCVDGLVANLIEHADADGHILYEARQTFELTPEKFQQVVSKVREAVKKTPDQRRRQIQSGVDEQPSWPFFNGLGNLLFGQNFAVDRSRLHLNPIDARKKM